jgi:heme/copper-type cytochrome/quinol oxidase subunit 3
MTKRAMWVFLASDGMLFAVLLAAYSMARHDALAWPNPRGIFNMAMLWAMTAALAASSVAMVLAEKQVRRGWVLAAMALGCGFLVMQTMEWSVLIGLGAGLKNNPWGVPQFTGYFFLITGLHGFTY